MPNIKCICGNIIGLGEIPSPNQLLLISDVEYDKFQGMIDAEELFSAMKLVVKCDSCGRIHVYWNGFEESPQTYKPE